MTLTDLYYLAGGTAFHHEITEEIAVTYLKGLLLDYQDEISDYEDLVYDLKETISELESEIEDLN